MSCCRYFLTLSLLALLNAQVLADAEHNFSGFATLALTANNNDELIFRRDIAQIEGSADGDISWRPDSLIAGQWQGRWTDEWETTVQLVLKDRYDNSLSKSLEWAFVRYRPWDDLDLRIGRLGTDFFMLSDYRQVGYAFPWVRPPHDTYGLLSLYHFDGLDITKRFDVGDARLTLKLLSGNARQSYPTSNQSADLIDLDFDPSGINLSLEQGDWKWRYSYVEVHINNNYTYKLYDALLEAAPYWPAAEALASSVNTQNKRFNYHELGVTYDNNTWVLQAEAMQLHSQTVLLPNNQFWYLSVGRRLGDFSVYITRAQANTQGKPNTVTGPSGYPEPLNSQLAYLVAVSQRSLNGGRIIQDSWGLVGRWDFTPKMALKLQAERFHIDKTGANLWLQVDYSEPLASDQTATLITFALDMLF